MYTLLEAGLQPLDIFVEINGNRGFRGCLTNCPTHPAKYCPQNVRKSNELGANILACRRYTKPSTSVLGIIQDFSSLAVCVGRPRCFLGVGRQHGVKNLDSCRPQIFLRRPANEESTESSLRPAATKTLGLAVG